MTWQKCEPYLPHNRPDSRHHLAPTCIERVFDVHFRLLRNDCLYELHQGLQAVAEKEAKLQQGASSESVLQRRVKSSTTIPHMHHLSAHCVLD